jgi:hypothetical protein
MASHLRRNLLFILYDYHVFARFQASAVVQFKILIFWNVQHRMLVFGFNYPQIQGHHFFNNKSFAFKTAFLFTIYITL